MYRLSCNEILIEWIGREGHLMLPVTGQPASTSGIMYFQIVTLRAKRGVAHQLHDWKGEGPLGHVVACG